ncbi:hypothetical protein VDIAB_30330 [Vibrio diabolicus]|nr:hypothetical protein VDIAB_30330 [Vibrio diabolicus]
MCHFPQTYTAPKPRFVSVHVMLMQFSHMHLFTQNADVHVKQLSVLKIVLVKLLRRWRQGVPNLCRKHFVIYNE